MADLNLIEGAAAVILLAFLGWVIWLSRKTKRFRAGVFVEREYHDKEEEE